MTYNIKFEVQQVICNEMEICCCVRNCTFVEISLQHKNKNLHKLRLQ